MRRAPPTSSEDETSSGNNSYADGYTNFPVPRVHLLRHMNYRSDHSSDEDYTPNSDD